MEGGVDVCLDSLGKDSPHCPHGPTLLFERYQNRKAQRFYACSACRNRKDCSFFQLENAKVSSEVLKARQEYNLSCQPKLTHTEYYKKLIKMKKQPISRRSFCQDCSILLSSSDLLHHERHHIISGITDDLLMTPTKLLCPLDNKKKNAQYLFSEKAVKFIISTIQHLGYRKVLCIGAPRIHEAVQKITSQQKEFKCTSLLLDLDHRYEQFFRPHYFCRYNMFNHHFFDGAEAEATFSDFISGELSDKLIVVTDPPFGGHVEVIAATMKRIMKEWKSSHTGESTDLSLMWFFPYFMEPRITTAIPSLTMLDYKVAYENHVEFTNQSNGRKQGSPVRIFTNISPALINLPASEGYSFCEICKKYVSAENTHCYSCDACTSKDGTRYVHCEKCDKCVKSSRTHCYGCDRCELPDHKCCQIKSSGCHVCGASDHKRRECPHKKTATFQEICKDLEVQPKKRKKTSEKSVKDKAKKKKK